MGGEARSAMHSEQLQTTTRDPFYAAPHVIKDSTHMTHAILA
jgi:hypothetical protein